MNIDTLLNLMTDDIFLGAVIFLLVAGAALVYWINNYFFATYTKEASVILATYTKDAELSILTSQHYSGKSVITRMVAPRNAALVSYSGVLYEVTLTKSDPIHTICFSNSTSPVSNLWRRRLGRSGFERIDLEGDFPAYFQIYVEKGLTIPLLEFYHPKTMQYFVDYCRNFDFEILGSTLYAYENNSDFQDDATSTMHDILHLTEIVEKELDEYSQPASHLSKQ